MIGKTVQFNKRTALGITLSILCLAFCGCGASIPDLTEEQSEQVAEYAANTILKYDANNRSRLTGEDPEKIVSVYKESLAAEATEEAVTEASADKTGTDTGNADTAETPADNGTGASENSGSGEGNDETLNPEKPQVTDISDGSTGISEERRLSKSLTFLELPEGCDCNYTGYEITDEYVGDLEGTGFCLTAGEGKKLLVLKFEIANTSGEDQEIDILDKDIHFKCTVNGTISRYSMLSMLPHDLATFKDTLQDGDVSETVILFEINEDLIDSVDTLDISLKNAPKSDTIHLM